MAHRELLAGPRLSVISAEPDAELARIARTVAPSARVAGAAELARLLDELAAAAGPQRSAAPRTLDLIGHSTAGAALLRLGDWVIDAASPEAMRWWCALVDRGVLGRLGIRAVRLLGCGTAGTPRARATLRALAALLGVEVHGAPHLLHAGHYGAAGFLDAWRFLLVEARALDEPPPGATARGDAHAGTHAGTADAPGPRTLDLAALPALPLAALPERPRWIAPAELAREILAVIRCDAGAPLPGDRPAPAHALALAVTDGRPGAYRVAHILFDGAFVEVFPDGPGASGVAYPVPDPARLHELLARCAPLVGR